MKDIKDPLKKKNSTKKNELHSKSESSKYLDSSSLKKMYWKEVSQNTKKLVFGDTTPKKIFRYYIFIIALGTALLAIPGLSYNVVDNGLNVPRPDFVTLLFTASSAFSDTGLSFFDISSMLTVFGQVVLLALIQLGGIGFVSLKIFIWILIRKKIGIEERNLIRAERGYSKVGGSLELIVVAIVVILFSEVIGAVTLGLFFLFSTNIGDPGSTSNFFVAMWQGIFTSVSAVNNAGFEIISGTFNSLEGYRFGSGVFLQMVIIALSIIGGIGFPIFFDLYRKVIARRRGYRHKFSLFSIICFYSYFIIGFLIFVAVVLAELFQPNSLILGNNTNVSAIYQWLNIIFTVSSSRSAGLSISEIGQFSTISRIIISISMFIGSSPASTGGGIRLTTIVVILFAIFTYLRGRKATIIKGKQISQEIVLRSFIVVVAALFFVMMGALLIFLDATVNNTNGGSLDFVNFIFIAASAFGTCGLSPNSGSSFGTVSELSYVVTIYFTFLMFLGQLTISGFLLILRPLKKENVEYSQEVLIVG